MSLKYRTSAGTSASNFSDLVVKVGDTLPIGTEVDYDGQTAPAGWQEVDGNVLKSYVLYDGNTVSTVSPTLNDNVDNYSYIEIYGLESGNRKVYTKINKTTSFVGSKFILSASFCASNGNFIVRTTVFSIQEKAMTEDTAYQVQFSNGGTATIGSSSQVTITKVIGWK